MTMHTTHTLQITRQEETLDGRGMPTVSQSPILSQPCDLQQGHYELAPDDTGDKRRVATYAAYVPEGTDLTALRVGDKVQATGPFDVSARVEEVDFFSYVVYLT
jgi:hypothetical protein